jgi:hypothetical protein
MPQLSAIEADISATKVKLASAERARDKELILMYGKLLAEQQQEKNILLAGAGNLILYGFPAIYQ